MKRSNRAFTFVVIAGLAGSAFLQSKPGTEARPANQVLEDLIKSSEKELTGVAETMPEEGYDFAPTNGNFRGVRNFAKQVKHAAAVHHLIAATILGEPISADLANESGPDALKAKAEVVTYLKDSFAHLHRAAATINGTNAFGSVGPNGQTRMGLLVTALTHSSNHYGQLVEYLRMNGLAPPQS
ncbi:MAG: hypothetical protein C5B57_01290 [Blastocatellia bacterium]|nr:MAG: hypothetical protein C5B57_01290 [Blastocatellia bacterium]